MKAKRLAQARNGGHAARTDQAQVKKSSVGAIDAALGGPQEMEKLVGTLKNRLDVVAPPAK